MQNTVNMAIGLKELGVKRGDIVAFYSESRDELISGYMGALSCGATITMYNTLYNAGIYQHSMFQNEFTMNVTYPYVESNWVAHSGA